MGNELRPARVEPRVVVFGIVSGDPLARSSLSRVCDAVATGTGRRVEPAIESSYSELERKLQNGAITLAWSPPMLARRLIQRSVAVALCCPIRSGGLSYHSALFGRRDGRPRAASDLHDARAAWVDPSSVSGCVAARRWCERQGVERAAFASEVFLGTHSAVARAVLEGRADLGATYANLDPATGRMVDAGWSEIGASNSDVQVIATIGPIPSDSILASSAASDATREGCERALSRLAGPAIAATRSLFRAERFERAPGDYLAQLTRFLD